jgi:potassium-transporting ATPase C chain
MKERARTFLRSTRQAVVVSVVLMLICGLLFPALLTGISALIFPHQAGGSLVEVDGKKVAAANVGQEFLQDYYLWSRPSQYHYNVYVEDKDGTQHYVMKDEAGKQILFIVEEEDADGNVVKAHYDTFDEQGNQVFYKEIANLEEATDTRFGGLASGSANYAPSNPDLAARVEADIAAFLEKNPDVKREDIPTDLLTASGSGLDPHISPASADVQVPRIAKASGLGEDKIREIIQDHTTGKVLGIFGEETVNVVEVNIDIGIAMGLIGGEAE